MLGGKTEKWQISVTFKKVVGTDIAKLNQFTTLSVHYSRGNKPKNEGETDAAFPSGGMVYWDYTVLFHSTLILKKKGGYKKKLMKLRLYQAVNGKRTAFQGSFSINLSQYLSTSDKEFAFPVGKAGCKIHLVFRCRPLNAADVAALGDIDAETDTETVQSDTSLVSGRTQISDSAPVLVTSDNLSRLPNDETAPRLNKNRGDTQSNDSRDRGRDRDRGGGGRRRRSPSPSDSDGSRSSRSYSDDRSSYSDDRGSYSSRSNSDSDDSYYRRRERRRREREQRRKEEEEEEKEEKIKEERRRAAPLSPVPTPAHNPPPLPPKVAALKAEKKAAEEALIQLQIREAEWKYSVNKLQEEKDAYAAALADERAEKDSIRNEYARQIEDLSQKVKEKQEYYEAAQKVLLKERLKNKALPGQRQRNANCAECTVM